MSSICKLLFLKWHWHKVLFEFELYLINSQLFWHKDKFLSLKFFFLSYNVISVPFFEEVGSHLSM